MRFLSADYLFPLHIPPLKKGVLQISEKGEIIAIFENRNEIPQDKLEIFDGVLCPGFVNAHCHLELSHLEGIAEKGKGFLNFVGAVKQRNKFTKAQIQIAIENAEKQMINNGIVAVGDICNSDDTLFQKSKKNLQYYNFIEIFGVQNEQSKKIIEEGIDLRDRFRSIGQSTTIVPHAPFSVPPKLMQLIANNFDTQDYTLSIHLHETEAENNLFEQKKGHIFDWLNNIEATAEIWKNRNSSKDVLEELENQRTLLVHNTFAKKQDLTKNYYCTCPKANLYIENTLADYSIFNPEKLCVGTDSLASNDTLSVLEELKIIRENSIFDLNTLLKIACKNGAQALGFEKLGTFEKGKTPGVNLVQNLEKVEVIQ